MQQNENSTVQTVQEVQAVQTVYFMPDADPEESEILLRNGRVRPVMEAPDPASAEPVLCLNAEGLSLTGGGQSLRGDFKKMLGRTKLNNLNHELLVRAARIRDMEGPLTAADATAGLGEDSFLLAAAGFFVKLFERDPVIALLLQDALRRAARDPVLLPIVSRMQLFPADSLQALPGMQPAPDVVVLDPMFPARQKSALIKKKFQLLQKLEKPCDEEEALLSAAFAAEPRRIVIKRPLKGPCIAGRKPDYALKGKTIRYDCFTRADRTEKEIR